MTSEQNQFHASLSTAIVTFKTLQDTTIGLQTSWNNSPVTSFVSQAPAPSDIIWENIGLVKHYRYGGFCGMCISLFCNKFNLLAVKLVLQIANHKLRSHSYKHTLSLRLATCNSLNMNRYLKLHS